MKFQIALLVLVGIVVCGCVRSGDFGAFAVTEVGRYGGHAQTNVALPKLQARWSVQRDAEGFTAHITDASFATVDASMQQAFGPPQLARPIASKDGPPGSNWAARDVGVAMILLMDKGDLSLVCVRGQTNLADYLGGKK